MQHHQIRSIDKNIILFEGIFKDFKACLEQGIKDRVILNSANLKHKNLSNANLDDAIMPSADFSGSNLTGANISEAFMKDANFTNTALYNTCFYDTNLTACNFDGAGFGGTDIFGTVLAQAQFSTLSCFGLDFSGARTMAGCIFLNPDGRICQMSKPPLVIRGMGRDPIILMDNHVKAGNNLIDHKRLRPLAEKLTSRALRERLAG